MESADPKIFFKSILLATKKLQERDQARENLETQLKTVKSLKLKKDAQKQLLELERRMYELIAKEKEFKFGFEHSETIKKLKERVSELEKQHIENVNKIKYLKEKLNEFESSEKRTVRKIAQRERLIESEVKISHEEITAIEGKLKKLEAMLKKAEKKGSKKDIEALKKRIAYSKRKLTRLKKKLKKS
ncbi:hypothetical protein D6745_02955 [Candidatus Woesearchaeota archaeon]|nr:MAG: hypothetical protein D6745_02955 [Candidatus Woesearchaeota archaeon]